MSKYQALIDALKAGPTSALFTHPRDCNAWKENEQFALACQPDTIRSLLADLERAEKHAKILEEIAVEQAVLLGEYSKSLHADDCDMKMIVQLGNRFDAALSQLKGVQ